jgi:hypothetical protein
MDRCYNSKNLRYKDWGGRGIKVCKEWHNVICFVQDMGERPEDYVLDRINNNGDYTPNNCRWVNITQSNRNTRKSRLWNGKSLKQLCEEHGVHYPTVVGRLYSYGWSLEDALRPSTVKLITYNNETLTMNSMAKKYSINLRRLYWRLQKGWPIDKALS